MPRPRLILALGLAVFAGGGAHAAERSLAQSARVCPAPPGDAVPDFQGSDCETVSVHLVDPQGREIWIRTEIEAPERVLSGRSPAGVFLSAKAASEVFLNGRRLGANGRPGATRAAEIPGRMDAVFYAPPETLRPGFNEVTARLSSHHGFLRFKYPVHQVAIGPYADPTRLILGAYWPSLIPFGALVAGALYFAISAAIGGMRLSDVLLAVISLSAAGQILVETYRGLSPYLYPVHEWRMLAVLALSATFGLCLAGHVIATFAPSRPRLLMLLTAAAALGAVLAAAGYDAKAWSAILAPTIVSLVIAGHAAMRRRPQAAAYAAALAIFAALILAFPDRFLDTYFFYEVATLLLAVFVLQAIARERERHELAGERARARQLEDALARAGRDGGRDGVLKIAGAGAIDLVRVSDIVYCKGAGDYAELRLKDGRDMLHAEALVRLETALPANFLRVHRSFIVNTDYVRSLRREANGGGVLTLSTEGEIPVSRRTMPDVRRSLAR